MMICPGCNQRKPEDSFNSNGLHFKRCWSCRNPGSLERCGDCLNQKAYCSCARAALTPEDRDWLNEMSEIAKGMDATLRRAQPGQMVAAPGLEGQMEGVMPPNYRPPEGFLAVIFPDGRAFLYNPDCPGCETCDYLIGEFGFPGT